MSTPQAKAGPVGHESSLSEKSDVDQYPLHEPKLARYIIALAIPLGVLWVV